MICGAVRESQLEKRAVTTSDPFGGPVDADGAPWILRFPTLVLTTGGLIFINRKKLRRRNAPVASGPFQTLCNRGKRWSDKGIPAQMMMGLVSEHSGKLSARLLLPRQAARPRQRLRTQPRPSWHGLPFCSTSPPGHQQDSGDLPYIDRQNCAHCGGCSDRQIGGDLNQSLPHVSSGLFWRPLALSIIRSRCKSMVGRIVRLARAPIAELPEPGMKSRS